jgi:hypothetical protein
MSARNQLNACLAFLAAEHYAKHPESLAGYLRSKDLGYDQMTTPQLVAETRRLGLRDVSEIARLVVNLKQSPDARVIQWRTCWSHGRSSWDTASICWFSAGTSDADIEELLTEEGNATNGWSEHYRGVEWRDITAEQYATL